MPNDLIRKLFFRNVASEQPTTGYDSLKEDAAGGMATEYRNIIQSQMERWDVAATCASVEVRQLAPCPDGREVFVGLVRLHTWDRMPALRVLLGFPILEDKVRQILSTSWLSDVSRFAGLWLHASENLRAPVAAGELRQLVVDLTGPRADRAEPGHTDAGNPHPEEL